MKSLIVGLLLTAVVAGKPQVDFSKLGQTLTDAAENLGEGAAQAAGDVGETLAQAREEIEGLVEQAVQVIDTKKNKVTCTHELNYD